MEQGFNDLSEGEISDDGLKIVIESPKRKTNKKQKLPLKIDSSDKQVIESIEKELEETLEEKATKTNLTTHNVKNILKQVVTNEHVLALVRQTENPETISRIPYQPKLTRAKAKELFSSKTVSSLPWPTKPPSEVQQLISDELAEDSSGDEYCPAEEESEDDNFVHSESELRSVSPPTPVKEVDSTSNIQWTEDGVFKVPSVKTKESKDEEEEANIALRTRSKLSLSSTPLEVIEESFIPPDITTDMYDMDCDDDVWYDFLKKFTRPLDEITKATEDEDHDPEYNILADEEIDKVDTEELRADKAVKVTKKELNALIAELSECANAFSEEAAKAPVNKLDSIPEGQPQASVLQNEVTLVDLSCSENTQNTSSNATSVNLTVSSIEPVCNDTSSILIMQMDQKLLLEQQIRQHVQILTQTYLLTYLHPELHDSSIKCKESLMNFKFLGGSKEDSIFKSCNLEGALELIQNWEKQLESDSDEVKVMKQHTYQVHVECKQSFSAGREYIPTFPTLILETISKSDVFIYPDLLPRIPPKPPSMFKSDYFTKSEDELIAFGMAQFTPYLAQDSYNVTRQGQVKLRSIAHMIVQYMMPTKDVSKMYAHITRSKHAHTVMNPIKCYHQTKKAPTIFHFVMDLKEFGIVPPCKRNKNLLPCQWRKYLYPDEDTTTTVSTPKGPTSFTKVVKPPTYKNNKRHAQRKFTSKSTSSPPKKNCIGMNHNCQTNGFFCSTPKMFTSSTSRKKLESYFKTPKLLEISQNINSCIKCMKFNSSIFEKLKGKRHRRELDFNKFPNMPFLDSCNSSITENEKSCVDTPNTSISELDTSKENDGSDKNIEADSTILDIVMEQNNEDFTSRNARSSAEKVKGTLSEERIGILRMPLQENIQSNIKTCLEKSYLKLNSQDYEKLSEILSSFAERINDMLNLCKQLETILGLKHQDLLDEFFAILKPIQAKDVEELIPYYMLNKMSLFLRKLKIYIKEQQLPSSEIDQSLNDLSACMNIARDHVRNTILPLLKNSTQLTETFSELFPIESPTNSLLLTESVKQNDTEVDATMNDQDSTVVRLGTSCTDTTKRNLKIGPTKQTFAVKNHKNKVLKRNDSKDVVDDIDSKKGTGSTTKKKTVISENVQPIDNNAVAECVVTTHSEIDMSHEIGKNIEDNCDIDSCSKLITVESVECDSNISVKSSIIQHRVEESTDDDVAKLESPSNSNNNTSKALSWTRDEDKIILETLQKKGDEEDAFTYIAGILHEKTVLQIKERFDVLMDLFKNMNSVMKQ